jgi:CRP-like cAMP-binding protein
MDQPYHMSENLILDLKKHIDEIALMSSNAWTDLEEIVQISELQSEDFLFKEGEKVYSEVFLFKGILRGFYRSYEGEEINVYFFTPGMVLPPLYIRSKDQISNLNMQALSDVVIGEFNAEEFTSLRYKHESLMKYGHVVVEWEVAYKTQREILLLTKNAEERYHAFHEMYPRLENNISQYHIASYLGITPVSLSRIRKSTARL